MRLATSVPPIAHVVLSAVLLVVGVLLLMVAIWRLIRGAHSISSLHLSSGHVSTKFNIDIKQCHNYIELHYKDSFLSK